MAEPTAEDDNGTRQSPRLGEDEANHHAPPPPPFDDEERTAEDRNGERLPSPMPPVRGFRRFSPQRADSASPLLLNSEDLPDYSDLSNTSSFRVNNNDLREVQVINRGASCATTLRKTTTTSCWRKSGYACLFLTGILLSAGMILIGLHFVFKESKGGGSGQEPPQPWTGMRDKYLVILGGLSLFFIVWHTTALLFGLCSFGQNCSLTCLHWFMRLCHFGTIFLVGFIAFLSVLMYDSVPSDIFRWTPQDAILLLSILLACVMVAYCSIELVVDLCVECFRACRSIDDEADDEGSRNGLLL